jgi:hypothetical protein
MDIRFISTLTAADEERVADALMAAFAALLANLPITYALCIETTGRKVFQRTNMPQAVDVDHDRPLQSPDASATHLERLQ